MNLKIIINEKNNTDWNGSSWAYNLSLYLIKHMEIISVI